MKNSKSTVTMKAGKTKSAAPDKERFAQLKQQVKEAKLRLQSAKRTVRDAKESLKQAKHVMKVAKKATVVAVVNPMRPTGPAIKKQSQKKKTQKKQTQSKKTATSTKAVTRPASIKPPVAKAVKPALAPVKKVQAASQPRVKPIAASSPPPRVVIENVVSADKPRTRIKPAAATASEASSETAAQNSGSTTS